MRTLAGLATLVLIVAPPVAVSCASEQRAPAANATPSAGSDMAERVERFLADRESIDRFYDAPLSKTREERLRQFLEDESAELARVDPKTLDVEGKIDLLLLTNRVKRDLADIGRDALKRADVEALAPYAPAIVQLFEARQRADPIDPEATATALDQLRRDVERARESLEKPAAGTEPPSATRSTGLRAARAIASLADELGQWKSFRSGYDPAFDWWCDRPCEALDKALRAHSASVRKHVAKLEEGDADAIVGTPLGRAALVEELAFERIPYSPEELVQIAEREMTWCKQELAKCAREMGLGDDGKAALARVKAQHVPPGEQPALVRDLAREAIAFVTDRDLVTVPPLAAETWRMSMMSAEAQKTNPFFLGGEQILVSYPTSAMEHERKVMSLRANNRAFSRAVVFHELIPGHELQGFMNDRHARHRRAFATPFWTEGWALYWELFMWDLGFPKTPEEKVGMLFWRMHRCARIKFSLGFHLGQMTEQQCIDLLVDEVGHEKDSAEGEVRRSFSGAYGPLYQAGYMLGGLQLRALHREMVDSGRMTNRAFHDAVLQGGNIPIELVRARLTGEVPAADSAPTWRFDDKH